MSSSRRNFIKKSTFLGGGLLMGKPLPASSSIQTHPSVQQLKIMATNWGFRGSMAEFCRQAKTIGYDGIEVWAPRNKEAIEELKMAVEQNELELSLLAGAGADNFKEHLEQFTSYLELAISLRPVFVNCHAGKDFFSFEENKKIIEHTIAVSKTANIPIYHETHRSRMLFNAPGTLRYLEEIPELQITLDISHWCCVHESLLQNQKETIDKVLQATGHIHARVGHAEGPQITAIDAPEWKDALDAHLTWWDAVVERRAKGGEVVTITPEFGPPNYMPTVPYTGQPIADNWKVNARMLELCRQRYMKKD